MILYSLAALGGAAVLVLIDQLTKLWISHSFEIGELKELIRFGDFKVISITHIRNSGAAWGALSQHTALLSVFSVLIVGAVIFAMFKGVFRTKPEYISLSLMIAGGVGNLIDRIRLHEVVDFIKWEVFDFPVFNFADICVVVGAVLLVVCYVFFDPDTKAKSPKKAQGGGSEEKKDG